MYGLVGCGECRALWIVELGAETSECPRCGTRRPMAKRTVFHRADDEDAVRDARASMLAERQGYGDADLESFAAAGEAIEDAGPSAAEYLAGSGLDPEEVAAAGERASGSSEGATNRRERVEQAIRELDEATEAAVVERAAEAGVDPADAREVLDGLVRAGEASENGGIYRLL